MARPGISYIDVAKAAVQLKEQDVNPTVAEVRNVLKTGSNSTISRHLRDWVEKQGNRLEAEKGLPASLLTVVKGLYDAINENANIKIQNINEEANKKISDLTQTQAKLNLEKNNLNKEVSSLATNNQIQLLEISELKLSLNDSQQEIVKQQNNFKILDLRFNDKVDELSRLSLQLENVQKNLEHYREATLKQKSEEKIYYDAKINQVENKYERNRDLISKLECQLTEKNKESEYANQSFIELEQSHNNALKENLELNKHCENFKINLHKQQMFHVKIEASHEHEINEAKKIKEEHSMLIIKLAKLEEKYQSTIKLSDKLEDKLMLISDQNKFITKTNIELKKHIELIEA